MGILSELVPSGVLPQMTEGLGVSEAQVGSLVGVYALASAAFAIPLVSATLAMNRKKLLMALLVGFAASNMVVALSSSYAMIVAFRVIGGICAGVMWPMIAAYGTRLSPHTCTARPSPSSCRVTRWASHRDETDDDMSRFVELLNALVMTADIGARSTASHTCSFGSANNAYAYRMMGLIQKSGLNFIANPTENAYLQGRQDTYPKRRGLTRVKEMWESGINVCFGEDSCF